MASKDDESSITKKKIKIFRPCRVPRYLPGSVGDSQLRSDLKQFNEHRYKIFTATPFIDDSPPKIKLTTYFQGTNLTVDMKRMYAINDQNRNLLKRINTVSKFGGRVDCFNPKAYESYSKWDAHEVDMKRLVKQNKEIYRKISQMESVYSKAEHSKTWARILHKMEHMSRYPLPESMMFTKNELIKALPSISKGLDNPSTDRPKVYLDIHNRQNGQYVGRLVIELYHEYVPVTCQNFLTICKGDLGLSYIGCSIHKILRGEYFSSGDITLKTGKGGMSIYGARFAEENYLLKHNRPGVVSMVKLGKNENNSIFSITFRKMAEFDGKRVAFGKIVKGMNTLELIQDYARDVGRPFIYISDSGEYTSEFAQLPLPTDIEIKRSRKPQ